MHESKRGESPMAMPKKKSQNFYPVE